MAKSATMILAELDATENRLRWEALKAKFEAGAETYTRAEMSFVIFVMERMLAVLGSPSV